MRSSSSLPLAARSASAPAASMSAVAAGRAGMARWASSIAASDAGRGTGSGFPLRPMPMVLPGPGAAAETHGAAAPSIVEGEGGQLKLQVLSVMCVLELVPWCEGL